MKKYHLHSRRRNLRNLNLAARRKIQHSNYSAYNSSSNSYSAPQHRWLNAPLPKAINEMTASIMVQLGFYIHIDEALIQISAADIQTIKETSELTLKTYPKASAWLKAPLPKK